MAMKELFSKDYNGRKIVFYQDGQSWTWKSEGLEGGIFDSLSAAVKDAVNTSEVKIEESTGHDVEFDRLIVAYEIPGLTELPEDIDIDAFDSDDYSGYDIIDIITDKKIWIGYDVYSIGEFGAPDIVDFRNNVVEIAKKYLGVEINPDDVDGDNLTLIGQTEDKHKKVVDEVYIKVINYDTEEVVGVSQGFTAIDFIDITDDVMLTRYQVGDFGEMPVVDDPIFAIIEKPGKMVHSALKESGETAYVGDGGKHDGKQIVDEGTHNGYSWYTFVYNIKPIEFGLRIYDEDGQEVLFKSGAVFPKFASELTVGMDEDGILTCNILPILNDLAPKLIDFEIKNIKEYERNEFGDNRTVEEAICDIISDVTGEPFHVVEEDRTGSPDVMSFEALANSYEKIILDDLPVIKKHIEEQFGISFEDGDVLCYEAESSERSESNTVVIDIKKKPEFAEYDASVIGESAKCGKVWFNDGEEVVLQMSEGGDNRQFIEDMFMKTHTLPNSFNPADGCVTFRYPAEECNGIFFKTIEEMGFTERKPVNESADEDTIFDFDSDIYTANYKVYDGDVTFVVLRKMSGQYVIDGLSDSLTQITGKIVDKIEELIGYKNFFGSIDVEPSLYCNDEGTFHVIVGKFQIDDDFGDRPDTEAEIIGKLEKFGFEDYMKGDYIKFDYFTK